MLTEEEQKIETENCCWDSTEQGRLCENTRKTFRVGFNFGEHQRGKVLEGGSWRGSE